MPCASLCARAAPRFAQETTTGSCNPGVSGCGSAPPDAKNLTHQIGYTVEELKALPDGVNMGLSCGNPAAQAVLKQVEPS